MLPKVERTFGSELGLADAGWPCSAVLYFFLCACFIPVSNTEVRQRLPGCHTALNKSGEERCATSAHY